MAERILLTSFDIWKPHHTSNSSDDLFTELLARDLLDHRTHLLRKLPVNFELAPQSVISKIEQLKPDVIVCCGMAEKRSLLTIESNGKYQEEIIETTTDVEYLVKNLEFTAVSHDAGRFVCNYLYYSVLKHIQDYKLNCQCIFAHVPVLNEINTLSVLKDFSKVLKMLTR